MLLVKLSTGMNQKSCSKGHDTKICIANNFPEDADYGATPRPKHDYSLRITCSPGMSQNTSRVEAESVTEAGRRRLGFRTKSREG